MASVHLNPGSAPIFHAKKPTRENVSVIATFVTSVVLAILGILALSGVLNVSTGGGIAMTVIGTVVTLSMLGCCLGIERHQQKLEREERQKLEQQKLEAAAARDA